MSVRSTLGPVAPRSFFAASFVFVVLALASAPPLFAGAFGSWVSAPSVAVPGEPIAELEWQGTPSLLLRVPTEFAPLGARIWNPTTTIDLDPGPQVTIGSVAEVVGVQTAAGPRIYASGDFFVGGVATRIISWDGVTWGLPGGSVLGVVPRDLLVRETPAGPQLWVGGDVMLFPGLTGVHRVAVFDGATWASPGSVLGTVEAMLALDEGAAGGDSVFIAGSLVQVDAQPISGIARFDGTWDPLAGGLAGSAFHLNPVELVAGDPEVWVSYEDTNGAPRVASFDGTGWTDLTPSSNLFLLIPPREFHVLPTFGGPWVISDGLAGFIIASVPGATPFGWDPLVGEWSGVGASAEGAFTFESSAGLFPAGTYRYDPVTDEHEMWEVGFGQLIRGDVDGDGSVNLADAIQMLAFLFGGESLDCLEAVDTNEDGTVSISDTIHLLGFLFSPNGVTTLFPPYPQCGPDLDLDNLDCANHEFCL